MEDYKKQNQDLRNELKQREKSAEELINYKSKTDKEKIEMQRNLNELDETKRLVENKNSDLERRLEDFTLNFQEQSKKIQKLREEHEELIQEKHSRNQKKNDDLLLKKEELLAKTTQITSLRNELLESKQKLQELQETNELLENELKASRVDHYEISRLQDELENLRERKVNLENQLRELGDSAGGMKNKLSL